MNTSKPLRRTAVNVRVLLEHSDGLRQAVEFYVGVSKASQDRPPDDRQVNRVHVAFESLCEALESMQDAELSVDGDREAMLRLMDRETKRTCKDWPPTFVADAAAAFLSHAND